MAISRLMTIDTFEKFKKECAIFWYQAAICAVSYLVGGFWFSKFGSWNPFWSHGNAAFFFFKVELLVDSDRAGKGWRQVGRQNRIFVRRCFSTSSGSFQYISHHVFGVCAKVGEQNFPCDVIRSLGVGMNDDLLKRIKACFARHATELWLILCHQWHNQTTLVRS